MGPEGGSDVDGDGEGDDGEGDDGEGDSDNWRPRQAAAIAGRALCCTLCPDLLRRQKDGKAVRGKKKKHAPAPRFPMSPEELHVVLGLAHVSPLHGGYKNNAHEYSLPDS